MKHLVRWIGSAPDSRAPFDRLSTEDLASRIAAAAGPSRDTMSASRNQQPIVVAGGGIGGLAAA
ncbi:MAG: hypothetical protein ABW298_14180, partial [Candidatus Binatia bacterium]